MLSFSSYGEWTKVTEDTDDDSYYIDFQTVNKKSDGHVVWWEMRSSAKGWDGAMSSKSYNKGDCEELKTTFLSIISYTKPMGGGESEQFGGGVIELETILGWNYPPPDSVAIYMLEIVCSLADQSSMNNYQGKVLELIAEFESYEWEDNDSSYEVVDYEQQNDDLFELELAELKSEQERIQYNRMLAQASQDEQDTARSLIIEDQLNTLKNAYINNIAARVRTFWRYQGAEDDWTAEVYVVQDRDGTVVAVDVRNANVSDSSLAKSFMDSVERAVYKSSPLPAAPDEAVFEKELYFIFSVN